ncbi:hypothetical protein [Legionella waltersii]|uniref:Uncharacterized protein n=1 Tax=Legionella waltersii TaxID=66969 RepID=A0A0W1ANQ6_9GAMM|nr:hypothetical protein [Legionella waltersii]KTD82966.1 hypothetical protein Lwal_0185 [Legionella waltersii]SNU97273.1 Uncharacterised protein [Legionella waltersii]
MGLEILDSATPQTFVDALRRGDFVLASCFEGWAKQKYKKIAGKGVPEDTNVLIAILLAETDLSEKDAVPLMVAYDSSKDFVQASLLVLFNGARAYLNLERGDAQLRTAQDLELSASETPNTAMHEYFDNLPTKPFPVQLEKGVDTKTTNQFKNKNQKTIDQVQAQATYLKRMFDAADNYRLSIEESKTSPEAQLSAEELECHTKLVETIDMLKNASLYSSTDLIKELDQRVNDIKANGPESKDKDKLITVFQVLKDYEGIKTKIQEYLTILHDNPVHEPEKNPKLATAHHIRRLAGQNMLLSLYQGEPKEKVMKNIERHLKTIERNKPGLAELGFIGWIKNLLGMNKGLSSEQDKFKETMQKLKESNKAENRIDKGSILH